MRVATRPKNWFYLTDKQKRDYTRKAGKAIENFMEDVKKQVDKFPVTPMRVKVLEGYTVAISEDDTRIYFWDGKSPTWNFFYKISIK